MEIDNTGICKKTRIIIIFAIQKNEIIKMRLTDFEIQSIQTLCKKHFGRESRVYLFGSRVDDSLKGGDIDLFISSGDTGYLDIENKIRFLVDLKRTIGDRKIDLVLDTASTRRRESFYNTILLNRIELTNIEQIKNELV